MFHLCFLLLNVQIPLGGGGFQYRWHCAAVRPGLRSCQSAHSGGL